MAAAATAQQEPNDEVTLENVPTIKAYNNVEFLTSATARHIRIMCELQEPMQRLEQNGVENYIQILGSHLVLHPEQRTKQLADLQKRIQGGGPRDEIEGLHAKLKLAKHLQPLDKYYVVAMDLAEKIAKWSQERAKQGLPSYHISTGGGPGIMEAANRGAQHAGEITLGFGSTRPEWGTMNQYVSSNGAFQFHYGFMRKFWGAYKCMGFVALPGGFGTLDELFEFLKLVSSRKIAHKLPIILLGEEHWKKVINFDYLVQCSLVSSASLELFVYKDTAEEAFQHLVQQVQQNEGSHEYDDVENAKRRRLAKKNSCESSKGK